MFGSLETLPAMFKLQTSKHPLLLVEYSKLTLQCKGSFSWEGLDLGKGPEAARLDVGYFFWPGLNVVGSDSAGSDMDLVVCVGTVWRPDCTGTLLMTAGTLLMTQCVGVIKSVGRDALDDSDTLICLCLL